MRLEPFYRARFSTPDRWSVQLDGAHGTETQSLLFAQGRCEGQVTGSLRAANFPRLRTDDTLTPDFRGVIETNDGAAILFTCRGYVHTAPDGVRQLVGAMTHISDHERYRWLNKLGSLRGLAHRVPDRRGRDGCGDRTDYGERPRGREPGRRWWLGARRQTEDDIAVHGSEGGIHRTSDP
ncbi:MAG: DUF3237 family protein, partial [Solirubrobacteraceae bacterium]